MTPSRKLALATAALVLFLAALVAAVVSLLLAGGNDQEGQLAAIVMVTAGAAAVAGAGLRELHARYLRSALRMSEEVASLVANCDVRVGANGPYAAPELQTLAASINRLADARQVLLTDIEARVTEARASLEIERGRLAALMADLDQGVVVCNLDGRVLLYNQRARVELGGAQGGGAEVLGLGRSIYTVFDRALIAHALERLQQGLGAQESGAAIAAPASQFVTLTAGGRLLRAHMSPVLGGEGGGGALSGFVLTLDDITAVNERDARRDELIQTFIEGGRGPLGSIRAAAEMLTDFDDMALEQRARFLSVIRDEARSLSRHLETAADAFSDDLRESWPLEEMLGTEFIEAAARRISERSGLVAKIENVDEKLWLRLDSFALMQALSFISSRLHDEYGLREVRLELGRGGRLAQLDLIWVGTSMNNETAMSWELDSMKSSGESTQLSVREVIDRCNGELWFQRERVSHRAFFRILLPIANAPSEGQRATALTLASHSGGRPEFYDFDLFRWSATSELDDRPLAELAYTVFDTETTGLEPSAGDEIIQIGATRIVNRRLLRQECVDQLVDPQRPLSRESIRIHGITPDMLAGQPTIATVLPSFHAFCADTVLVAHNAAFDMRFLEMKEASLSLRFDQPVLDTLLLSAVIYPNQESHRLEAIAERLGVSVFGRHTALGDAMVTGEVFLKMLPLLEAQGIHTLRQAREASERTYHARLKY